MALRVQEAHEKNMNNVVMWPDRNITAVRANARSACLAASRQGETSVLVWLRVTGRAWNYRACCLAAAENGHLTTLIWLRDAGRNETQWGALWVAGGGPAICKVAKRGARSAVFEWARGVGCDSGGDPPYLSPLLKQGDIVSSYSRHEPQSLEAIVMDVNRSGKRLLLLFPSSGKGDAYPVMRDDIVESQVRYVRSAGPVVTASVLCEFEYSVRRGELETSLGRSLTAEEQESVFAKIDPAFFMPALVTLEVTIKGQQGYAC